MSVVALTEREPKQFGAVDRALAWMDAMSKPDLAHAGKPTGAVVSWAASYAAIAAVLIAGAFGDSLDLVLTLIWVSVNSRLPYLILRQVSSSDYRGMGPRFSRPGSTTIAGLWLAHTAGTLEFLSGGSQVAFAAAVAIIIGLRHSGLQAWNGEVVPAWQIVRAIARPTSVAVALVATVLAVLCVLAFKVIVDPMLMQYFGVEVPSRDFQFAVTLLALPILGLPALIVIEAVNAIARHDRSLAQAIADLEAKAVHDVLAKDMHDEVFTILNAIRWRHDEGNLRHEDLDQLSDGLARLQHRSRLIAGPIPVSQCLRHVRRLTESSDVVISVIEHRSPRRVPTDDLLDHDQAEALARGLKRIHDNSVAAGASELVIEVSQAGGHVVVEAHDNAGGFVHQTALAAGGGLSQLRLELDEAGGCLEFRQEQDRTVHIIRIPYMEQTK